LPNIVVVLVLYRRFPDTMFNATW